MSCTQTIRCDRCRNPLPERGARARSVLTFEGEEYTVKSFIESRGTGNLDLCEPCLAVVLVQYARLIAQDLMDTAARAPARAA